MRRDARRRAADTAPLRRGRSSAAVALTTFRTAKPLRILSCHSLWLKSRWGNLSRNGDFVVPHHENERGLKK
jgi:hypothetical protein